MSDKLRFGEILVRAGILDRIVLERILTEIEDSAADLGEVLIARGTVDELTMLKTISMALNLPSVSLAHIQPDQRALELIPRALCEEHFIFPVELERSHLGEHLHLAMANPSDVQAIKRVTRKVRLRIRPLVASAREIRHAINRWYGPSPKSRPSAGPRSPSASVEMGPGGSVGGDSNHIFDFSLKDLSLDNEAPRSSAPRSSAPRSAAPREASARGKTPTSNISRGVSVRPTRQPTGGGRPSGLGRPHAPPRQRGADLREALEAGDSDSLLGTGDLEMPPKFQDLAEPRSQAPRNRSVAPLSEVIPGATKPIPPLPSKLRTNRPAGLGAGDSRESAGAPRDPLAAEGFGSVEREMEDPLILAIERLLDKENTSSSQLLLALLKHLSRTKQIDLNELFKILQGR